MNPLMTCKEAAEVLRCSERTVRAKCASGELPAMRFGRRWLVIAERLRQMMEVSDDKR